jgi:hypothetical protein
MRRNACQVMVQGAALIVGIVCAMIVSAAFTADVRMMSVMVDAGDAICGKIVGNVLLAREYMLKMSADQRHDSGDLGNKKQPQQPRTNSAHF